MAQLTAAERLEKVKTALGVSGNYSDDTILFYIDEVINELIGAGVEEVVAESGAAVGCIALGVNDLWNYSSGGVKHSEQFNKRLIQLCHSKGEAEAEPNMELKITIPKEEDLTNLGWTEVATLASKVVYASEFTVSDTETVKAIVTLCDGTTVEGENDRTGNRRSIQFGTYYIMIMPNTKLVDGKFTDADGFTTIAVSEPYFCESHLTLQSFDKKE